MATNYSNTIPSGQYIGNPYPIGTSYPGQTTTTTTTYVGAPTTTTYVGAPTTTTYVGAPTTATYVGAPTTYVSGPMTTTGYASSGYTSTVGAIGTRVAAQQIPVESRIQYIPFEKKYIEYDTIQKIIQVPYQQQIVQYQQIVHTQKVPIQKTITDYYAVQTQIEYIPKQIQQTIVQYQPVQRTFQRIQYLPVQTQIVHYPQREKYIPGQGGQYIQTGYTSGSQVKNITGTTTTSYQRYQTQPTYNVVNTNSQYGNRTVIPPTTALAYQTYQTTVPPQAAFQMASSASQYGNNTGRQTSVINQPTDQFILNPNQNNNNFSGQPSSSQVKNNTSYATNV